MTCQRQSSALGFFEVVAAAVAAAVAADPGFQFEDSVCVSMVESIDSRQSSIGDGGTKGIRRSEQMIKKATATLIRNG